MSTLPVQMPPAKGGDDERREGPREFDLEWNDPEPDVQFGPITITPQREGSYDQDRHIGRNSVRRVKVVKVDDSGPIQRVTVTGLADEEFELPLRGQGHGLSGVPPVGSVGYAYLANGRPDQAFIRGLEHPDYRPKDRAEGEVVIYAKAGQSIDMNENGDVNIKPKAGSDYSSNPVIEV